MAEKDDQPPTSMTTRGLNRSRTRSVWANNAGDRGSKLSARPGRQFLRRRFLLWLSLDAGRSVFPFSGGKSRLASWILEHIPGHDCYVEVFGGAAGVLVNKDPDTSAVEVYDRDGDLVHFFEVLWESPDELVEWLTQVPYSRELYHEWADLYYLGYRPDDDIERAGQFFYLRYTQWGGAYGAKNGFATSKVSSRTQSYSNKRERLEAFARRFSDVVIENVDWQDIFAKYDSEETVF